MMLDYGYVTYVFLGLIFLCVGSFLNVVIVRIPQIIVTDLERSCHVALKIPLNIELPNLNIVSTRSHCVHCKTKIPFWHNIPVLSFILLNGKCFACSKKISWLYPMVEILTSIFSLLVIYKFGYTWQSIYCLLFMWIIICLSMIDIQTKLLPDCLTLSLLWLGLLANINSLYASLPYAIYGSIAGYLSLWITIHLYYLLTKKFGMGGGDFKLFAALGAWFGLFALPKILIISSVLGIIFGSLYMFICHKPKNTPIPFGPFLSVSGIVFMFFNDVWFLK